MAKERDDNTQGLETTEDRGELECADRSLSVTFEDPVTAR